MQQQQAQQHSQQAPEGGFPAGGEAWARLCRRATELVGAPTPPLGWDSAPSGAPSRVVQRTLWGWVQADFIGATLVGLSWSDAPLEGARPWPPEWWIGWSAGSAFQRAVWAACLDSSAVTTYGDIAHKAERPGAARAVGNALGANPLGPLVPCHWPGRSDGALGGFRWGPDRKRAWRAWEQEAPRVPA